MVKLKTKQNRIYAISGFHLRPRWGYTHTLSIPSNLSKPRDTQLFTTIHHGPISSTIQVKAFAANALRKICFFKTCMTRSGNFESCCDSHIWANKIEAIRRLSDGHN